MLQFFDFVSDLINHLHMKLIALPSIQFRTAQLCRQFGYSQSRDGFLSCCRRVVG